MAVPPTAVMLPSVLVIDRSALGLTVTNEVAVLLAGLGSVAPTGAVIVAVLTIVPEASGPTMPVRVNDTLPPTARLTVVAMSPATGPGSAQLPPVTGVHVHDGVVTSAGRASFTAAATMSEGPLLATTMV